jgi:hypothetical protein
MPAIGEVCIDIDIGEKRREEGRKGKEHWHTTRQETASQQQQQQQRAGR